MEHNPKIEGIAKGIATFILILGIISGAVLIFIGLANDSDEVMVTLIAGGVIDIISSVVFWVFVNLLVNISLKLDHREIIISNRSIREMAEVIIAKSMDKSQYQNSETQQNSKPAKPETPKYDEAKVQIKQEPSDDEIENVILGEILTGGTTRARHILMTKKGMSLSQATEYIDKLKNEIK